MRVAMKNAKTVIDDQDRARKAAVMGGVVASNKALDVALKQVKVLAPETPAIFFRRRHWLQPGICQRPSVSCQHSPGCWTWNPGGIKIRELVRIIPYWYFMFQDQAETFDDVVQHSDSSGQCDCCQCDWPGQCDCCQCDWGQVVWEGGGGCDGKKRLKMSQRRRYWPRLEQ